MSPGLEAVLANIPRTGAIRVLDLGPAVPENVEFFSGVATRIQLVDAFREALDGDAAIRILRTLDSEFEEAFHLVLLWDCLNYLSPNQGAHLVETIAGLCRPDARCLAMVFDSDTMPASPQKFRVVDERHLTYESSTTEVLGAPQMTPAAVERVLSGFSIEHSFVLRNGVREYVAIRDSRGAKSKG